MNIALIGAGAAGAACVSVLRSRGTDFSLFEKSRGVGGRLTTRRISGVIENHELTYDHGAPEFSSSNFFKQVFADTLIPSIVQPWSADAWISKPAMPQLVKALLGDTRTATQVEIDAVEGEPGRWFLREKRTNIDNPVKRHGPFSHVVITAPAPQAIALLREVECSWKDVLSSIKYHPCWALMVSMNQINVQSLQPSEIFSSGFHVQNQRPGRTIPPGLFSWVAHACPEWSLSHLEEPVEKIQPLLLREFLDCYRADETHVVHATVHRWRYSTVAHALGEVCLSSSHEGLFYAGDGCLGTGVAGALESGW